MLGKGVALYLDDILIYVKLFEEYLKRTEEMIDILRVVNLMINLKKSKFMFQKLVYLNHIIGDGQLIPNPARIVALYGFCRPLIVTYVRALLGFLDYI